MIDYSNTKFYILKCNTTKNFIVGATTKKYLCQKLTEHKEQYKKYIQGKSQIFHPEFQIIKNDDYNIILINSHNCKNKEELERLKEYYKNKLLNDIEQKKTIKNKK